MSQKPTRAVNLRMPPEVMEQLERRVAQLQRLVAKHPEAQTHEAVLTVSNLLRDAIALGMVEHEHEHLSKTLERIIAKGMRRGRPYAPAA